MAYPSRLWWATLLLVLPTLAIPRIVPSHVVDGDTIAVTLTELPDNLEKVSIRILGVDTPESTYLAKCDEEKQLGLTAKQYLKDLMANAKTVKYELVDWDKYGGRILGHVHINKRSVKDILIEQGLARPYDGGKKSSWCPTGVN